MAIIYSYPDKTPILGNDILLGTDRQNKNQTKNFTVDAIKDYERVSAQRNARSAQAMQLCWGSVSASDYCK